MGAARAGPPVGPMAQMADRSNRAPHSPTPQQHDKTPRRRALAALWRRGSEYFFKGERAKINFERRRVILHR